MGIKIVYKEARPGRSDIIHSKLCIYTLCRHFTYYINSWPCQIPLHKFIKYPWPMTLMWDFSYYLFHTEVVVLDALLPIWSFPTSVSFCWGWDLCDAPDNYFPSDGETKSPTMFMKCVHEGVGVGRHQGKLRMIFIKEEIRFQVFFKRSTDAYVKI